MRLRLTAVPQLLDTKSPSRGGPSEPGELTTTTPPLRRRFPSERTLRKSRELRSDWYSGSESLPALVTTILDRRPPGAGAHAMAETVATLSAAHFWLICPFHRKSNRSVGNLYRLRRNQLLRNPGVVRAGVVGTPRRKRVGRENSIRGGLVGRRGSSSRPIIWKMSARTGTSLWIAR